MNLGRRLGLMLLGAAALSGTAQAQRDAADSSASDPPAQAARLSFTQGSVSLEPGGTSDWTVPQINRPLSVGDTLWSDEDSRAEVELDGAALRLDSSTSIALLGLDSNRAQLRLSTGSLDVSLRRFDASGTFEIDAPNAAVWLLQPGTYRISADVDGNTTVQSRDGAAQITGADNRSITLRPGQGAQFSSAGFDVASLGAPDSFDSWCQQREWHEQQNAAATPYVSDDAVGYDELNDYGSWQEDPDDGYVWYPNQLASDWAPYRYGQWAWVAPWGWSWVDYAPWGYAPFHYGRWTYRGGRWGWVPASPRYHAVFAPALVAWVGGGGAVGWVPLAPGEVYVPGYRVSDRYLQTVNITNTVVPNNSYVARIGAEPHRQAHFANWEVPHALSVVSRGSFVGGEAVARHLLPTPAGSLTPSALVPAIAPERASVLGVNASHAARPPAVVLNRAVLARRAPSQPPPSFEQQLRALHANGDRPLTPSEQQRLSVSEAARRNVVMVHEPAAPPHSAPIVSASTPVEIHAPLDLRFESERAPQARTPQPTANRSNAPAATADQNAQRRYLQDVQQRQQQQQREQQLQQQRELEQQRAIEQQRSLEQQRAQQQQEQQLRFQEQQQTQAAQRQQSSPRTEPTHSSQNRTTLPVNRHPPGPSEH